MAGGRSTSKPPLVSLPVSLLSRLSSNCSQAGMLCQHLSGCMCEREEDVRGQSFVMYARYEHMCKSCMWMHPINRQLAVDGQHTTLTM
jgi:hypothetical protein